MNRAQFIQRLRKYARRRGLEFRIDEQGGKGSHCVVYLGGSQTTVQHKLTPGRIERTCKQLGIDRRDL